MDKIVFEQKRKLLKTVSGKTYYGLINHMGQIYNSKYDITILMARKASNLYLALLPLVKVEYFGKIEKEHQKLCYDLGYEPIVISDRALDWILAEVRTKGKNTRFKRILIVDDIIIHGTTIASIKRNLIEEYQKAGLEEKDYTIDIMAYAENIDSLALQKDEVCNAESIEKCTTASWKEISSEIIHILYTMGQPYTSYVPNAEIIMDSNAGKAISKLISEGKMKEITDNNMKWQNAKAYSMIVTNERAYSICETYRVYEFRDMEKYVFVPMVSLQPASEELLKSYMSILSEYIDARSWKHINYILENCNDESNYIYYLVVYVLSALAGWSFFDKFLRVGVEECKYKEIEEKMNFSCPLLVCQDEHMCVERILTACNKVTSIYKEGTEGFIWDEFGNSDGDVEILKNSLMGIIRRIKKDEASPGIVVEKLLNINNQLDEEAFDNMERNGKGQIRKRMTGVPLIVLCELVRSIEIGIEQIFSFILQAIDYGKGSIVPHIFKENEKKIFAAVLHAGEQNFRYYVDNYLPIMYGVYMLEINGNQNKEILWKQYYATVLSKRPFLDEDKEYLLGISVEKEFGDVIVEEALRNRDNDELKKVILQAKKLIDGGINKGERM